MAIKYIHDGDTREVALALIEVMEIVGNNPIIEKLQRESWDELAKILEGATANFLYGLIRDAREQVRKESTR